MITVGKKGKYANSKQRKSTQKHLLYILKDDAPIITNLDADYISDLLVRCSDIRLSQKQSLKEKFYLFYLDAVIEKESVVDSDNFLIITNPGHTSDFYIFQTIMKFVFNNDLLPPNKSQMQQYILYIKNMIYEKHSPLGNPYEEQNRNYLTHMGLLYGITIPKDIREKDFSKKTKNLDIYYLD